MGEYPNILLVDCFLRCNGELLIVKRKSTEEWFPSWWGSLWREVQSNQNPYEALKNLFDEVNVVPTKVSLKAMANNVFHDLKETYNMFLFIVDIEKKPETISVDEGEDFKWVKESELLNQEMILKEYKFAFPRFVDGEVLFYHSEYDFDNLLKIKSFSF